MTRATCRMIRRPFAALMPAGLEKVSRLARMQRAFDRRRLGRFDHGREINLFTLVSTQKSEYTPCIL